MEPLQRCVSLILISWFMMPCLLSQDLFSEPLLDIKIEFEEAGWRDILLKARKAGDNRRIHATVTINHTRYPDVQIRFKGNSSFHGAVKAGLKKIPLNLKASDAHPFAGGYETLKLANNYRDPSGVRELLAYQIAAEYVPVPKSTHAIVSVNGDYLGVYTATEGVSETMTDRYFCGGKKGLIQGEPDFHRIDPAGCPKGNFSSLEYLGEDPRCYVGLYEVRDSLEWLNLIRLTRVLDDSSDVVEEVLDVHLTLWMHALNNALVNFDSYLGFFCHNYYLYRDEQGVYHPLLWDLNLAFGGFHVLKQGVDVDFATVSPIVHERFAFDNRPLITELLKDRLYRRLYFSMMRTITDQWLINGRYLETAQALQKQIRPYIVSEKGTFYSAADFDKNLIESVKTSGRPVPGIKTLMEARTDYLIVHPLLKQASLAVTDWKIEGLQSSPSVRIKTSDMVTAARIWYQESACGVFVPVRLNHNGDQSEFIGSLPIRPFSMYFELEAEDRANLWPLNAPQEQIILK